MYYLSKKTQKLVAKALVVTSIAGMGVGINITNDKSVIAMAAATPAGADKGSEAITIRSTVTPSTLVVNYGTSVEDLNLPERIDVILSNKTTTSAAVKWDTSSYDGNVAKQYKFQGEITAPDGITNPKDIKAIINVDVRNKLPIEATVTSVSTLGDIRVANGTPIQDVPLPKYVVVNLNNNNVSLAEIDWNVDSYNGNISNTYTLTGTLSLAKGITNPKKLKVSVNVIVNKKVTKVSKIDDINVDYGTDFSHIGLPNMVNVTLNDNTTEKAFIKWTSSNPQYNQYKAGKYNFTGKLNLPNDITNSDNLEANVNVIVGKDKYETTGPAVKVEISGKPQEGETLIANLLDEYGNEFTTDAAVTYKWYSLDKLGSDFNNLIGENKDYKISKNDIGKYIGVCVETAQKYYSAVVGKVSKFNSSSTSSSHSSGGGSSKGGSSGGSSSSLESYSNSNNSSNSDNSHVTVQTGWVKDNNGNWYYNREDGTKATGWENVNEKWYYLNSDGSMKTGWLQNSEGSWYYLNSDGSMAANTTIDGYKLDKTGKLV